MIRFALTKCDILIVLVCCSDRENIPGITRGSWICKAFENEQRVQVRIFNYQETELPNTSTSSKAVSKVWANVFKKELPECSLLITSEEYGNFVAAYMGIKHIAFDILKNLYPVSASDIRRDLSGNWSFLPDSVKVDFAIKIVITGTESTGKTTLAKKLAKHFKCSLVLEAARDIISNSNNFKFEKLHIVATEHAKRIDKIILTHHPLVIIDTDVHTTISYAQFLFGRHLEISSDIYNSNKANVYLYLTKDVQYLQDGTRLSEAERNMLDQSHRQVLKDHDINFIELKGNWDQRFADAVEIVNKIISQNPQTQYE